MKRENLITITRHPSVFCYVEEGTRKGSLHNFVRELLDGGNSARELSHVGRSSFYVHFFAKPDSEREMWRARIIALRRFAAEYMV